MFIRKRITSITMEYIEKLDYAIKHTQEELEKTTCLIETYDYNIETKIKAGKIIDGWMLDDLEKCRTKSDMMSDVLKKLRAKKINEFNRLVTELLNN